MVRVGITGIGFMGMIHYLAAQKVQGLEITAICSRDEKKLKGDWRGIQGNFGPPGAEMDLGEIARHRELADLLQDDNVDLVDICLPPAMHADATVAALEAGKHVFCEKPIALSTADADRMVSAAKSSGRALLIGQVLPFLPEYDFAYQAIQSGKYGKLLGGHFKRIISEPTWIPDFFEADKVGGPVIDLHIHDAHFIRLVCGMPEAVFSSGRARENGVVEFVNSQFLFADPGLSVTATSGVLAQQGRGFTHAFEIYCEQATLLYDLAIVGGEAEVLMPLTVLNADGKVERPTLGSGDMVEGFVRELTEVVRAVESGESSPLLDGTLARDALVLCQKQCESLAARKFVPVS